MSINVMRLTSGIPTRFLCLKTQGHGKPVDWWAFGVFIYEMVAGFPPFYDEDITNTYKKILAGRFAFPPHFSNDCRDLIRRLLQVCSLRNRILGSYARNSTIFNPQGGGSTADRILTQDLASESSASADQAAYEARFSCQYAW